MYRQFEEIIVYGRVAKRSRPSVYASLVRWRNTLKPPDRHLAFFAMPWTRPTFLICRSPLLELMHCRLGFGDGFYLVKA